MKCSLGSSHFLKEISSLSHSVVFLYFFALIAEEGFLISSCYSLTLHSDAYISPFLLYKILLTYNWSCGVCCETHCYCNDGYYMMKWGRDHKHGTTHMQLAAKPCLFHSLAFLIMDTGQSICQLPLFNVCSMSLALWTPGMGQGHEA